MSDRFKACGRLLVGSGTDTYDPVCELPAGHTGSCKSTSAIDQHRLMDEELRWIKLNPESYRGGGIMGRRP